MGGECSGVKDQSMLELEMKIKATIEAELNSKKETESNCNTMRDRISSDDVST